MSLDHTVHTIPGGAFRHTKEEKMIFTPFCGYAGYERELRLAANDHDARVDHRPLRRRGRRG